jgi:hypothetical protein
MPEKHVFSAAWPQPLQDKGCNESSSSYIRYRSNYKIKYYFKR